MRIRGAAGTLGCWARGGEDELGLGLGEPMQPFIPPKSTPNRIRFDRSNLAGAIGRGRGMPVGLNRRPSPRLLGPEPMQLGAVEPIGRPVRWFLGLEPIKLWALYYFLLLLISELIFSGLWALYYFLLLLTK